jgi:RimJ/RimL family protein N-acetyltransferase
MEEANLMRIRSAAVADSATVLNWVNSEEVWAVDNPEPYRRKSQDEFDPSWHSVVKTGSAWMMEIDNQPVGHFGWVPQPTDVGEFYIVIGETDYWGMGYGRSAMEWMLSEAALRKLRALYGRVLGHNQNALKFFEKLGFDHVLKDRNYFERYGSKQDLHWIVRNLSSSNSECGHDLLSEQLH